MSSPEGVLRTESLSYQANHSYTVSDVLPTAYYPQPFDFTGLDERLHDYFWEMNAQVAHTNESHRWQP
jgi:hypothetical protein